MEAPEPDYRESAEVLADVDHQQFPPSRVHLVRQLHHALPHPNPTHTPGTQAQAHQTNEVSPCSRCPCTAPDDHSLPQGVYMPHRPAFAVRILRNDHDMMPTPDETLSGTPGLEDLRLRSSRALKIGPAGVMPPLQCFPVPSLPILAAPFSLSYHCSPPSSLPPSHQ